MAFTSTAVVFNSGAGIFQPPEVGACTTSLPEHVIEESLRAEPVVLNSSLQHIKMQVQYMDSLNDDRDDDISFKPEKVLKH